MGKSVSQCMKNNKSVSLLSLNSSVNYLNFRAKNNDYLNS